MQPGFLTKNETSKCNGKNQVSSASERVNACAAGAVHFGGAKEKRLVICRYGQFCWRPDCHFKHGDDDKRAQHFAEVWATKWNGSLQEQVSASALSMALEKKHKEIESSIIEVKKCKSKVDNAMKSFADIDCFFLQDGLFSL
jgi:hypothetical protein